MADRIQLFEEFVLDTARGCVLRAGRPVHLRPQSYEVLKYLVENAGLLVSKDKIIKEVWQGRAVTDGSLGKCIEEVRDVLGENARKYVKNVRGRGYIFDHEANGPGTDNLSTSLDQIDLLKEAVEEEQKTDDIGVARPAEALVPMLSVTPAGLTRKTHLRTLVARSAVGVLIISFAVAVASFPFFLTGPAPEVTLAKVKSMAVLPFKPLVPESRDEVLEIGMADTLITKLNGLGEIVVRPWSSVRRYTGLEQDPVVSGRELRVDAVLDGSLQSAGDRIRVTVRLVRVADGKQLWSDKFDEKFGDIFAVQDSISERVVGQLSHRLSGGERELLNKRYTGSVEAYQHYLKGRYFWNKRTGEGFKKAIENFNQAIAIDPKYAQAYVGLADTHQFLGGFDVVSRTDSYSKSRAAARKALEQDDTLAEAHASLGLIAMNFDWDWSTAEREFRRAIQLNPNYATAHHWYAEYLVMQGRFDECMAEIRRAHELDPPSLIINTDTGKALYLMRRYDEAIEQLHKTLEMDPHFFFGHFWLALAFEGKGLHEQALIEFRKARELSDDLLWAQSGAAYVYAVQGRQEEARRVLDELKTLSKKAHIDPLVIATIYIGLGEKDQAFAWLEREYEVRSVGLTSLKVYPLFDSLRSDSRFTNLMLRVGLEP